MPEGVEHLRHAIESTGSGQKSAQSKPDGGDWSSSA